MQPMLESEGINPMSRVPFVLTPRDVYLHPMWRV